MTDAVYLTDSERREFTARVDRVLGDRVVLNRTCFYPEGGGQPADHGTLALADGGETWSVTDVQKKDTIYHTIEGTPPDDGTELRGELDWERRHAHMRYHTAQHLLSAICLDEFAAETRGNQLYDDRARIDVGHGKFSETDLADIEARINELVDDAREVTWYELDRERAEAELDPERTRIHLLPDSITELRIVEIAGTDGPFDRTACAGTHVSNTAEIGEVDITGRRTQGSDAERLTFQLEEI